MQIEVGQQFLQTSTHLLSRPLAYFWYPSIFCSLSSLFIEFIRQYLPFSGRVDRASATEAVDSGSIPGRVKPKTIKIGIHSFPA